MLGKVALPSVHKSWCSPPLQRSERRYFGSDPLSAPSHGRLAPKLLLSTLLYPEMNGSLHNSALRTSLNELHVRWILYGSDFVSGSRK